jgi:TRAP-type C4-dicarboxylate transport system permease large subunit
MSKDLKAFMLLLLHIKLILNILEVLKLRFMVESLLLKLQDNLHVWVTCIKLLFQLWQAFLDLIALSSQQPHVFLCEVGSNGQ